MIEPLFEHLLVPTDGSESSIEAGRLAFRVAQAHDSAVTLLHVIDETEVDEMARASEKPTDEVYAELEMSGRGYLQHLSEIADEFELDVQTETADGEPHQVIVDLAQTLGADLIVMGHVGQRGPRRVLIGSVTERVLRFSDCPVLVS